MKDNRNTKALIIAVMTLAASVIGIAFFFVSRETQEEMTSPSRKIPVVATIYPLAFLAETIGGEYISVRTLVPPGVEAHDFDPSIRDIAEISRAQILFVSGGGIDVWAENLRQELEREGVSVNVVTEGMNLVRSDEAHADEHEGDTSSDPHFWMDPVLYAEGGKRVLEALRHIDPEHREDYERNFLSFQSNLDRLHAEFLVLGSCPRDTVIVSHNFLSYPALRYGFSVRSLARLTPESEVSAGELSSIITEMREKKIDTLLLETLASPAAVETVARELGARILPLHSLEGLREEDRDRGLEYFSLQEQNLISLRGALQCETTILQ